MSLKVIAKSEALRMIRSQFGSLCRIELDEGEARALDEAGELIVSVILEDNPDPYRQMLSIACQLERKPDARTAARRQNAMVIARNLLNAKHH